MADVEVQQAPDGKTWAAHIKGDKRQPRPVGYGETWQAAVRDLVKKTATSEKV